MLLDHGLMPAQLDELLPMEWLQLESELTRRQSAAEGRARHAQVLAEAQAGQEAARAGAPPGPRRAEPMTVEQYRSRQGG